MDKIKAMELNHFAKSLFDQNDPLCWAKDCWARVHVEAERPIPESLRSEFYEELTSENGEYRNSLEESVRYFGVKWV